MKGDAFTGGVAPGGLWNQSDIRILICYLLNSVSTPLSGEEIRRILLEKELANYFETGDALSSLERNENVRRDGEDRYILTDAGVEIADSLDVTLPLSVRDKALEAALTLLARSRSERENQVEIQPVENGCQVTLHISGGASDLMTISLYVPDNAQAELVRDRFHGNPGKIYQLLLAALTGDDALTRELLSETGNQSIL